MKNLLKSIHPQRYIKLASLAGLMLLVLAACSPSTPAIPAPASNPTATLGSQTAIREAQVQSVEIHATHTGSPQITAIVRGSFTEACASLGESQLNYASNTFKVAVYSKSRADIGCAQVITPFETVVPLDVKDLPAGNYTVTANGVSAVFTLPLENPTSTPQPAASQPAANPAPTGSACVDSAAFVADVTIPDNSLLESNTPFTKTWRLRNTGSCTWDSSYLVAYISGTTMSQQPGYWIVQPGQTVAPGQSVDISVGLTSPVADGVYTSYWGLKKENGPLMPIQGSANGNSFYVRIRVNSASAAAGNITAASIGIQLEQGSGTACTSGATYFVQANLTADNAATASYEINSTAGQIAAGYFQTSPTGPSMPEVTGALVFDQAGTKTINLRFVGPYPYPSDITVNLRVNGGDWHNAKLSCQ